jgi:hypothetical protein
MLLLPPKATLTGQPRLPLVVLAQQCLGRCRRSSMRASAPFADGTIARVHCACRLELDASAEPHFPSRGQDIPPRRIAAHWWHRAGALSAAELTVCATPLAGGAWES